MIDLGLGYSDNMFMELGGEMKVESKCERNKKGVMILECCEKEVVGEVC